MLNRQHVEDIEDDRYLHVVSRSQSRFAVPINPNRILQLEFHPSGHYLGYCREDGSLTVWKLGNSSFARSKKMVIPDAMIHWISWNSQEVSEFVTCSGNHELLIWGIDEKKREIVKLRTLNSGNKNNKIERCIFDPSGNWLLSQQGLDLHFWDVKSDYQLKHFFQLDSLEDIDIDNSVTAINWTNSGSHLVIGLSSGKLIVLQTDQDLVRVILVVEAHRSAINSIVLDPWGQKLITGGEDGSCNLWELATMCCQMTLDNRSSRICSMDIDSQGKILAVTSSDNAAQFYDIIEGRLLASHNLKTEESDPLIKFYPDKSWFILSGKHDSLERHFTPGNYNDLTSFWKVDTERQNPRNRANRKPIKRDSKERGRVSKWDFPKSSRFNDRF